MIKKTISSFLFSGLIVLTASAVGDTGDDSSAGGQWTGILSVYNNFLCPGGTGGFKLNGSVLQGHLADGIVINGGTADTQATDESRFTQKTQLQVDVVKLPE